MTIKRDSGKWLTHVRQPTAYLTPHLPLSACGSSSALALKTAPAKSSTTGEHEAYFTTGGYIREGKNPGAVPSCEPLPRTGILDLSVVWRLLLTASGRTKLPTTITLQFLGSHRLPCNSKLDPPMQPSTYAGKWMGPGPSSSMNEEKIDNVFSSIISRGHPVLSCSCRWW